MKECLVSATIKPTIDDEKGLYRLLDAGADIIRIPFWIASEERMRENIKLIRSYSNDSGRKVQLLIDLPGNKIRFGQFRKDPLVFIPGQDYYLVEGKETNDEVCLPVEYAGFAAMCEVGDELICGDGECVLNVTSSSGSKLTVRSEHPSTIYSKKGIAIQGKSRSLSIEDAQFMDYSAKFAAETGTDWVALSFTESVGQLNAMRQLLAKAGNAQIKIMSKIESQPGIDNLALIVGASDGMMVARGDLVNYTDFGLMGVYQKMIIEECKKQHKFSMISTGIMMSIFNKARPRPAEISDIVNAVIDGADAIQFCEETAHYRDAAYVVRMAKHIIKSTADYYSNWPQ